jgi:hypothetical protein
MAGNAENVVEEEGGKAAGMELPMSAWAPGPAWCRVVTVVVTVLVV